jgi:hypothetical protein
LNFRRPSPRRQVLRRSFGQRLASWTALGAVPLALVGGGCGSSDSGTEGTGSPDGGAAFDAGTSGDGGTSRDGSYSDANGCLPGDISDFKPAWKPPTPFNQGVCSPAEVTQFRKACIGASSTSDCNAFTSTSGASYKCGKCILSYESADHYGPLILHKGWVELNIAGCIANAMNDPTGVKCAANVQFVRQCELAACAVNCPVTNQPSLDQLNACTGIADDSICRTYLEGAACILQLPDAGALGRCVDDQPFDVHFDEIVGLFCGGGLDAGGAGG